MNLSALKVYLVSREFSVSELKFLKGQDIQQYLGNSERATVYAVTLGMEYDLQLRRLMLSSLSDAIEFDRQAVRFLESGCEYCLKGFSPGYGDFPLSANRDILQLLNAQRTIGLCCTDDFVLTPQKSITGICRK